MSNKSYKKIFPNEWKDLKNKYCGRGYRAASIKHFSV